MAERLLIDHTDCVLAVIDVQPAFLDKLPDEARRPLVSRICWLIGVATWLGMPIIVTAEDMPHLGGPVPEVARILPDTTAANKMIFGLAGDPDILAAVERTTRKTAVLTGLETDVCVAQSALGLLERGYRVVAVADATGSPGTAHHAGLARMRDAGAVVLEVKGLYYEWLRTVERVHRFRAERADLPIPDGLTL